MDILYQRKWYAGWYSYTNYINSYLNAAALLNIRCGWRITARP